MAENKSDPPWKCFTNTDRGFLVKSRVREYPGEPILPLSVVTPSRRSLGSSASPKAPVDRAPAKTPKAADASPSQKRAFPSQGFRGPDGAHWAMLAGGALAAVVIGRKRRKSGVVLSSHDSPPVIQDEDETVSLHGSSHNIFPAHAGLATLTATQSPVASPPRSGEKKRITTPQSSPSPSHSTMSRLGGHKRGPEQEFLAQRQPNDLSIFDTEEKVMNDREEEQDLMTPLRNLSSKLDSSSTPSPMKSSTAASRSAPGTSSASKREAIQKLRGQLRSREEIIYEMQGQMTEQDKNLVRQSARCKELEAALRTAHKTASDLAEENARLRQKISERPAESLTGGRTFGTPLGLGSVTSDVTSAPYSGVTSVKRGSQSPEDLRNRWTQSYSGLKEANGYSPSEARRVSLERSETLQAAWQEREKGLQKDAEDLRAEIGRLEKEKGEQKRVAEHEAEGREEAVQNARQLEQELGQARQALAEKDKLLEDSEKHCSQLAAALAELERKVHTQAMDIEAIATQNSQSSALALPLVQNVATQGNGDVACNTPSSKLPAKQVPAGSRRTLWPEELSAANMPPETNSPVERHVERLGSRRNSPTTGASLADLSHTNPLAWLSPPEREKRDKKDPRIAGMLHFSNPMADDTSPETEGHVTLASLSSTKKVKQSPGIGSRGRDAKAGSQSARKSKQSPTGGSLEDLKLERKKPVPSVSKSASKVERRASVSSVQNGLARRTGLAKKQSASTDEGDLLTTIRQLSLEDSIGSSPSASPVRISSSGTGQTRSPARARIHLAMPYQSEPNLAELKRKVGRLNSHADSMDAPEASQQKLEVLPMEDEIVETSREIRRLSASLQDLSPYNAERQSQNLEGQATTSQAPAAPGAAAVSVAAFPTATAEEPLQTSRYDVRGPRRSGSSVSEAELQNGTFAPPEASSPARKVEDWEDNGWSVKDELARLEAELETLNGESEHLLDVGEGFAEGLKAGFAHGFQDELRKLGQSSGMNLSFASQVSNELKALISRNGDGHPPEETVELRSGEPLQEAFFMQDSLETLNGEDHAEGNGTSSLNATAQVQRSDAEQHGEAARGSFFIPQTSTSSSSARKKESDNSTTASEGNGSISESLPLAKQDKKSVERSHEPGSAAGNEELSSCEDANQWHEDTPITSGYVGPLVAETAGNQWTSQAPQSGDTQDMELMEHVVNKPSAASRQLSNSSSNGVEDQQNAVFSPNEKHAPQNEDASLLEVEEDLHMFDSGRPVNRAGHSGGAGSGGKRGDVSDDSLEDMLETMLDDMAQVCAQPLDGFMTSSPRGHSK